MLDASSPPGPAMSTDDEAAAEAARAAADESPSEAEAHSAESAADPVPGSDGDPAPEASEVPATDGEEGGPPRPGGRTPFARRLEDPQRVDGGGRWSVDSTRRRCCRCDTPFPDHDPFHTVLEPASDEERGSEDAREVFVRRDYCTGCFESDPPATVFAHWRCVLPPPPDGARKVVNLASLLAHFHQLVETPAVHIPDEDEEGASGEGSGGGEGSTPPAPPLEPHIPTLSEEKLRLVYLLALFLVRRRMLKWEGVEGGVLQLRCKESDRPVGLPEPPWSEAELAEAVAEFEDLFH